MPNNRNDGGTRGNYNLNDYQRGEKEFVLRGSREYKSLPEESTSNLSRFTTILIITISLLILALLILYNTA